MDNFIRLIHCNCLMLQNYDQIGVCSKRRKAHGNKNRMDYMKLILFLLISQGVVTVPAA